MKRKRTNGKGFTKTARKTNPRNRPAIMRGGIRF